MVKKSSNIEILRIVAMLLIVIHHYCVHGVFNFWHTNSNLLSYINIVRPFIWQHIFHPAQVMDKPWMIFYLLGAVLAVFIFAILLDKLIMFVFKKPIDKIIELVDKFIALKWKKCYRFWLKLR